MLDSPAVQKRRPRKDLGRLSLEAALELDRLRRGKDAALDVIDAFEQSLNAPPGVAHGSGRLHLNDSPRAEEAYDRAARSVPGLRPPLDKIKLRLVRILKDIRPAFDDPQLAKDERILGLVSQLETFCVNLHEALATERPAPRRSVARKLHSTEADVG